jgi:thymidylate synthase (FAD)
MRDRHGSPFEHNSLTFFVSAPIFVFREFMRHRIASYNEESGRYRELRPVFYVPGRERKLVQEGKPGHYEFVDGSEEQYQTVVAATKRSCEEAYRSYQEMLAPVWLGRWRIVTRGDLLLDVRDDECPGADELPLAAYQA